MVKNNINEISSKSSIEGFLVLNPGWTFAEDRLKATFVLPGFETTVIVMNKVFEAAREMDHHPRLTNVYNRLEFSLCTHSAGDKVTGLDIELAKEISKVVSQSAD